MHRRAAPEIPGRSPGPALFVVQMRGSPSLFSLAVVRIESRARQHTQKRRYEPHIAPAGVLSYAAPPEGSPTRMSDQPRTETYAPIIWRNALMFALTFAAAVILVPWYGLTHGFSG